MLRRKDFVSLAKLAIRGVAGGHIFQDPRKFGQHDPPCCCIFCGIGLSEVVGSRCLAEWERARSLIPEKYFGMTWIDEVLGQS